jgi:hypothetical protein
MTIDALKKEISAWLDDQKRTYGERDLDTDEIVEVCEELRDVMEETSGEEES